MFRSVRKWVMLATLVTLMQATVVCNVPDHGSIGGIDYDLQWGGHDRHHSWFGHDDRDDDHCWFGCDDDDDWSFDFGSFWW